MAGISHNCKGNRPCGICGKPDYCNWVEFPETGDILEYCHRISGNPGDTTQGRNGGLYRCSRITKEGFTVWEPLEQYERNREQFLKLKFPEGFKKGNKKPVVTKKSTDPGKSVPKTIKGVADVLPPEKLDKFYRTFMDLLVLEDKHEEKLRNEWDKREGLFDGIVKNFQIKSIPPEDFIRFSSYERLKNLSRKKIMEKLIDKCGEPLGVPGFYQRRDGKWTFYKLCGIAFPIFDSHGNMVRIRVNDDYPVVLGSYQGKEGKFVYDRSEDGTGWFFIPSEKEVKAGREEIVYLYESKILVWKYGEAFNKIMLTEKGYPEGKVQGKYKNFSSYQEGRAEDGTIFNRFHNGCQSNSFSSVYTKAGDDPTVVYVTEGEKKAIVANMILNVPVVSFPGVGAFGKIFNLEEGTAKSLMDNLRDKGMRLTVLVFDADKKTNELVLKGEEKAVRSCIEKGLKFALGAWNANWGKGLDDVLLLGVMPKITYVA